MDTEVPLSWQIVAGLSLALALCVLVLNYQWKANRKLKKDKRSGEVKRGFMTEQWLPLVDPYPWDPQNFRFLGSPIDGIQFEEDEIVLVEVKSGKSQLSLKQKHIRDLVNNGKVRFREVRVRIQDGEFERLDVR